MAAIFALGGCGGCGGVGKDRAAPTSTPVKLVIALGRPVSGSADGGHRGGHPAAGYRARIEGDILAFSGSVDPAASRVFVTGARAMVLRAGGRFTIRLYGLRRRTALDVHATSPGRRPSVDEVDVVRARSGVPSAREPQQVEPNRGPPGNADAVGGRIDIDARDFAFLPTDLKAKAGQQIVWRNKDRAEHALRPVSGPRGAVLPRSRRLKHGDRYDLTLLKPGIYAYTCAIHPWMRGKIVARGT